jgi:hypothetical protein
MTMRYVRCNARASVELLDSEIPGLFKQLLPIILKQLLEQSRNLALRKLYLCPCNASQCGYKDYMVL